MNKKQHRNNQQQKQFKEGKQHDYVQLPFGNLVFDLTSAPLSSVHQLCSVGIFVFLPGGATGLRLVEQYQVAFENFKPEMLTILMKEQLVETADDPEQTKRVWFNAFSNYVRQAIDDFIYSRHGMQARIYRNSAQADLDMDFMGTLLEITPTDIQVNFTSRRRNGAHRLSIGMMLGHAMYFTSQPEESEFSTQGDFDWEQAQGEYIFKTRKYHFQLSVDARLMQEAPVFDTANLAISVRRHLNVALQEITGQSNSIEKLTFY